MQRPRAAPRLPPLPHAGPPGAGLRGVTVMGSRRGAPAASRLLLSDHLRQELGLTGTHVGCEHGVCGCCTVLLDGAPVRSCLMLAVQAEGHDVTTIEGLARDGSALPPRPPAFHQCPAAQCGLLTPRL